VLGAGNGQVLYVWCVPQGPGLSHQIFNRNGSSLLDQMRPDIEYRGQLRKSGDHVLEVINRGQASTSYTAIFGIERHRSAAHDTH